MSIRSAIQLMHEAIPPQTAAVLELIKSLESMTVEELGEALAADASATPPLIPLIQETALRLDNLKLHLIGLAGTIQIRAEDIIGKTEG